MLKPISLAVLVYTLSSLLVVRGAEPTLREQLGKLAPHAAAVAFVEVEDIEEVDARRSDGNLQLDVRFRILRSTGEVRNRVDIVKERTHSQLSNRQGQATLARPHGTGW